MATLSYPVTRWTAVQAAMTLLGSPRCSEHPNRSKGDHRNLYEGEGQGMQRIEDVSAMISHITCRSPSHSVESAMPEIHQKVCSHGPSLHA